MKQKTLTTILLLMLTVTLFTGCNSEPPKPQAVVIDMRAISEAGGINEKIKEHMKTVNQQISEEMKALSAKLTKELDDEKSSLGESPSDENEKKIQTLQQQLQKQFSEARQAGNARRRKERSDMGQSFIDDVMPLAQKVALEHGASIILKTNAGVFWSDGSVDITDEVIGLMPSSNNPQSVDKEQN